MSFAYDSLFYFYTPMIRDYQLVDEANNAISQAISYLISKTTKSGCWQDFQTNRSGQSTCWVTSYTLWKVGHLLPPDIVHKAKNVLEQQKQIHSAWGYSKNTPPDCDSTLHAYNALSLFEDEEAHSSKSLKYILLHQNENGGFSTYNSSDNLLSHRKDGKDINFDGWTQSHVCVSAVALETLQLLIDRSVPVENNYQNLLDYLVSSQHYEGYWESYWWRSKYYSTCKIIKIIQRVNKPQLRDMSAKALNWIVTSMHHDGFFDNGYDAKSPCVISTALAINTVIDQGSINNKISHTIKWLLGEQLPDGSWSNQPYLQIPPPHIIDPTDFDSWGFNEKGVGSCSSDQERVYTTATVVETLGNFINGKNHA